MKLNIPEDFIETIKHQALTSREEIYGWLLGYQENGVPNVLSIFECQKFEQQTLISAIPHAQEFQEISSVLPQGIGPIGIYHSHPASSDVFHSHADDSTLLSLSKQFPNSISIVTNGTELNCYQTDKENITQNIKINSKNPKIPNFFLIDMNEELNLKIHKNLINPKTKRRKSLRIKIVNEFREFFEHIWEEIEFFYDGSKIGKERVSHFFVDKFTENPIQIKFPSNMEKTNGTKRLEIKPEEMASNEIESNIFKDYTVKLSATIPIYIVNSKKSLFELKSLIKTELISNNLLQKLYNSYFDYESREILLPKDIFITFFGFFIRIILHDYNETNHNDLKDKTSKFILKLVSQINSFTEIPLKSTTKNHLQSLLKKIKELARNYDLNKDLIKKLNTIYID